MAEVDGGDQGRGEDPRPEQVDPERPQPVGAGAAALGGDDEPPARAQHGRAERLEVDGRGERRHAHAGESAGALGFVRRDVVPPVPQIQADLEGGGVAVEHQPDGGRDLGPGRAEPEEEYATDNAKEPVDGRHGVVDEHQGVREQPAGRHGQGRLPVLLDQRLVGAARPAHLLGEEVGPGGRALADGQHVRGVHGAPVVAGARVLVPVQFEAGGHVLGDRVVQAADLAQRRDAHHVVGADEHGRLVAVAGPLDQRVEEELLGLGGLGDGRVVVPVDLRSHDEGDVGVAEVTHHPFKEVGERGVVGVDGGEEVVAAAVLGRARRCNCRVWCGPGGRPWRGSTRGRPCG